MKTAAVALVLMIGSCSILYSRGTVDRKVLRRKYEHKFIVALRPGLAFGICADHPQIQGLVVRIDDDRPPAFEESGSFTCEETIPEPIHKGEVLAVKSVIPNFEGYLLIEAVTVSPHAIKRGLGINAHESLEVGKTQLRFKIPHKKDYGAVAALAGKWIKVFDSQKEAARYGNTASGAFVKEVRLGMTFAEVESVLGVPEVKIDLGKKVLYKYKDMTIEFRDGKVADVR